MTTETPQPTNEAAGGASDVERVVSHDEPMEAIAAELVALAVKAGRRASYDLLHACDAIRNKEEEKFFRTRAKFWLDIFSMDSGIKDYRHSLHREIWALERKVENLTKALKDAGIECDQDGIPF